MPRLTSDACHGGRTGPGIMCLPSPLREEKEKTELYSECIFHYEQRLLRYVKNSSAGIAFARAKTPVIILDSSRFKSLIKGV